MKIMSLINLLPEIEEHHTRCRIISQVQVRMKKKKLKTWYSIPLPEIHTPIKKPQEVENKEKSWIMRFQ
jgi:hypothetical protein